ncbi:hypothetical protein AXG93_1040s1130 [Marchantia polymorpha subsp. ruderalis]|uniref:Iron-sulfur cluster biosynthesis family protein n=1 Tax=Marchantia polymorpha subsp. ruderalis TaxID=1480154 RepID=A0A176VEX6_MARPO|nr:hypothetical protein AXG93_1040s1130 [Marchantia polymorpha subsp. ruderalis]
MGTSLLVCSTGFRPKFQQFSTVKNCESPRLVVNPRLANLSSWKPIGLSSSLVLQKRSSLANVPRYRDFSKASPLARGKGRFQFRCTAEAGGSLQSALKFTKTIQTDSLPPAVRDNTMKAIDDLGGRVTNGDVASRAGLKVTQAESALQALAADSDGFLEVSDEGDVLYVFPKDYRTRLASKSLRLKVEPVLNKIQLSGLSVRLMRGKAVWTLQELEAANYRSDLYLYGEVIGTWFCLSVIKISLNRYSNFELMMMLVLLFCLCYTRTVAVRQVEHAVQQAPYWVYQLILCLRAYYSAGSLQPKSGSGRFWDPYYNRRPRTKAKGGMNFFESVFSFVFGDGDPNEGLEERRWKVIGDLISSKGGVVTAEELAPYLEVPPVTEESKKDEAFVLPVLLRFDGYPEVDAKGNILYRFPSLQRTANDWIGQRKENSEDTFYLAERRWNFSKANKMEQALVIGLGAVNLVGVVILGSMLRDLNIVGQLNGTGLIPFASKLLPWLQGYTAAFFAIPAFRWLLLQKRNTEIEDRNRARIGWAVALQRANKALQEKLSSARDLAQRTFIGSDRIIYSTEKDFSEQSFEAREWDKQLKERQTGKVQSAIEGGGGNFCQPHPFGHHSQAQRAEHQSRRRSREEDRGRGGQAGRQAGRKREAGRQAGEAHRGEGGQEGELVLVVVVVVVSLAYMSEAGKVLWSSRQWWWSSRTVVV